MQINLPMQDMRAVLSHDRRIAVPFYRDDRKVTCLQFEPAGPVARDYPIDTFDRNYKARLDQPLEAVSLKLIGACRTCYLPGSRVMSILLEIFNMTQTNGTGDLTALSQAELTETYNKLAAAAGKPEVKGFKDKATAVSRIQALQGDVAKPTAQQEKAQQQADEAAAKKTAPKAEKPAKPAAPAPKNLGQHLAAKKAAKKEPAQKSGKAAEGEKKPRGQGIGAFACDLIVKHQDLTNEQVLEKVKAKFPEASTSASSIAWYRNKLKSEGQLAS
jgi:hypothetical protein